MKKSFTNIRGVKIEYALYYSMERKQYEVWKTVKTPAGGICTTGVFIGTKKECDEFIRKLKEENN